MTAAILVTSLTGRFRAAQEYVLDARRLRALVLPVLRRLSGHRALVRVRLSAERKPIMFMQVFAALKSQEVFVIDLSDVNGLLSFPSFHTILAVLAAAALWSVPDLCWLTSVWAALIVVSTVTTGWHFIIDVLAGFVVVAISIAMAKAFMRIETRWQGGRVTE